MHVPCRPTFVRPTVESPVQFFAACGPKFTQFSRHAQEKLQFASCNAVFCSMLSCFAPQIFAIRLRRCSNFAPNLDVYGPPIVFGEGPQITDPIL